MLCVKSTHLRYLRGLPTTCLPHHYTARIGLDFPQQSAPGRKDGQRATLGLQIGHPDIVLINAHPGAAASPFLACHYRRLAPASERCRRTKSAIQRSTTTKRMNTGTNEWGAGLIELQSELLVGLLYFPSYETCDSAQACCCYCARGSSDE